MSVPLPAAAAAVIDKQPSGIITIIPVDGGELLVDKELLCSTSTFFSGLLNTCDTGRVQVDESRETFQMVIDVINGKILPNTYDTRSSACWDVYKKVLVVADKYDMQVVKERCEKWLVSRCLRGKTRCLDFKFQDLSVGAEWLSLCQKFNLRDLGWYCAYDMGGQLAQGMWPRPAAEVLHDVSDEFLLKTIIEAVQDYSNRANQAAPSATPLMDVPPLE